MADKRTLRQVTDTHKKAQIVVAQATGVGEMELVQRLLDGELSADDFIAQSVGLNQIGHEQAVRLAERYVRDVRGLIAPELVELPTVGVSFDYGQSAARAISTVKATERAQQEATRRASAFLEGLRADAGENARRLLDSGSLTAAQARRLKHTFRRWTAASIHSAHRSTVIQSAEAVGSGWRVVTDGNPCSFCAMLASYGEDVKGARAWPSHYFHPDCGCTIQEVPFGVDVEWTDRELELIRLREEAEKHVGTSDRKGMIAYMRAHGQGILNDATIPEAERKPAGRPKKKNTSNSGKKQAKTHFSVPRGAQPFGWVSDGAGGFAPPERGAAPFKPMPAPPKNPQSQEGKAYWKERQDALPLDFKGDWLEPDDIQGFERLLRLGEKIEPIKKLPSAPSDDFIWLNKGNIPVEMKSTKDDYRKIVGRIYSAVKSARRNHPEYKNTKRNFLIDLRERPLTERLKSLLANYNTDRQLYQIEVLWVMEDDGRKITKIHLN